MPLQSKSEIRIKVQSAVPLSSNEIVGLKDFMKDVASLTNNEVKFEIMPPTDSVDTLKIIKKVSAGSMEAAFGHTHKLAQVNPAAMLFGAPLSGAGVGLDSDSFLSWFYNAGGSLLYEELWVRSKLNIKGFILQTSVPRSLGWFDKPIKSLNDLQRNRLRYETGIPSEILGEMGVSTYPMKAADMIPEYEKGNLDAISWCCPASDVALGIHEVLKNYFLQGLSETILNTDLYINREVYNSLSFQQQKAIEISARASLNKYKSKFIYQNGKALRNIIENHNVKIFETPKDLFDSYIKLSRQVLEEKAQEDPFFAKVWQSQKDFASVVVPYWHRIQLADEFSRDAYLKKNVQIK